MNEKSFHGYYIIDRLYLTVFFKFLLILKRVQLMTDQQYTSLDQITVVLKKHKKLEIFILSINIIAIIIHLISLILYSDQE